MAAYTAADVKKLREATAAGMLDCKKALDEAEGDYDKAIDLIRVDLERALALRQRQVRANRQQLVERLGRAPLLGAKRVLPRALFLGLLPSLARRLLLLVLHARHLGLLPLLPRAQRLVHGLGRRR